MRNIYEVIQEKEAEIEQLQKDLEALRVAARLLSDDGRGERESARTIRPISSPARPNTDTELKLSTPLRQFP